MNTLSGFERAIYLAAFLQLNGLIEFIIGNILKGRSFSLVVLFCVLPGKKIDGYCNEKEIISTSFFLKTKAFASASLKSEIPPLSGDAGPTIMILFIKVDFFFDLIVISIWRIS